MRSNVARMFRSTYPIVIIDEFQDCIGSKLDFVRAFGDASQLILAGDAFQLLRADVVGCPAIDWVESLGQVGIREHLELNEPWRFSANPHILLAARAIREQSQLAEQTIPVYYGPVRPSAWRIMERLLLGWYGPAGEAAPPSSVLAVVAWLTICLTPWQIRLRNAVTIQSIGIVKPHRRRKSQYFILTLV